MTIIFAGLVSVAQRDALPMRMATGDGAAMTRVVVVSPGPLVRAGLRQVFERAVDIAIVGEICSEQAAQRDMEARHVDVVLLDDLSLHGADAVVIRNALAAPDFPPVLVLTMRHSMGFAAKLPEDCARGYVAKESEPCVLFGAIRCVAAGGRFVDPCLAGEDIPLQPNGRHGLSGRELEVLRYLARGYTAAGIAQALGVATGTVNTYRTRLIHKLGLRCGADIVTFAMEYGFSQI